MATDDDRSWVDEQLDQMDEARHRWREADDHPPIMCDGEITHHDLAEKTVADWRFRPITGIAPWGGLLMGEALQVLTADGRAFYVLFSGDGHLAELASDAHAAAGRLAKRLDAAGDELGY